jgi:HEAT repeat protein
MDIPDATSTRLLGERLPAEEAGLDRESLEWWRAHHVAPTFVEREGRSFPVVAMAEAGPLLYFPEHGQFGEFYELRGPGIVLYDDLAHAVRIIRAREDLGRRLAATAADLADGDLYDRCDSVSRDRILRVLGSLGPDAAVAVPLLRRLLDEPGPHQEQVVATLGDIGPAAAPAVPRLVAMAESDEANARGWCLRAFAEIGPAAAPAVPLLVDLLLGRAAHDPDPFYIPLAADALGSIGAAEAVPALVEALSQTDQPYAAYAILAALGEIGKPGASGVVPLVREWAEGRRGVAVAEPDPDPREAAKEALLRLS